MSRPFIDLFRRLAAAALLLSGGAALMPAQTSEPLKKWTHYREVQVPGPGVGLVDLVLDVAALNKSRRNHADLRLYSRAGQEIPYALRVRREVHTSDAFEAREFNRGTRDRFSEVSYDLGEDVREHNEVEVDTAGHNFRRHVEVEGSRDGMTWSTLVSRTLIFRFSGARGSVDERRVTYPVSRYPFLRVRVYADPQVDGRPPHINGVTVRRTTKMEGEILEFPVFLQGREPTREDGRAASAYRFGLGGRIPFHGLTLTITEASFSRPYRLQEVSDGQVSPRVLASGQVVRRDAGESGGVKITFDEHFARQLELTVTDDRNPPLSMVAASAHSYARQVIFDADTAGPGPVRLYYGNPKASAPHYDFAAALPQPLPQAPRRLFLEPEQANPIYEPDPQPFSERSPWLIYLVLGLASVALFVLLRNLTKAMGEASS